MTTDLEISRTLAAPVDAVWRALTEPGALAAWFWPDRFATTVEVDLRVGGRYRIDGPGAGMAVTGEYVAVDEPARLVSTWRWDGEPDETLVTSTLTAVGAATELVVVHERFTDDAVRDRHAQGWSDCLGRLPDWLARAA
jgi:uncharacterized protein YndB with AHSA1/START domain